MDRNRAPIDPLSKARMPVPGVVIPGPDDSDAAVRSEGENTQRERSADENTTADDYVENEGLVKQTAREAAGSVEGADGAELDAATEAAQRGRTA